MNDNDATLNDATMNGDANVDDGDRRPTRARGKSHLALLAEENRKAAEENDEFSGSEEEEEGGGQSHKSIGRVKPTVHQRYHWDKKTGEHATLDSFESVDGEKIFWASRWNSNGRRCLTYWAGGALITASRSLVNAKQDDEHCITLERTFSRETKLSQVPYREFFVLL